MPLEKGNSDAARSANIAELERSGHKPSQAIAIAYRVSGEPAKNAVPPTLPLSPGSGPHEPSPALIGQLAGRPVSDPAFLLELNRAYGGKLRAGR